MEDIFRIPVFPCRNLSQNLIIVVVCFVVAASGVAIKACNIHNKLDILVSSILSNLTLSSGYRIVSLVLSWCDYKRGLAVAFEYSSWFVVQ